MPSASDKLSRALESLAALQKLGKVAIRSSDLSRSEREILSRSGFLQEVVKGWYVTTRPDQPAGESTAWFASFWDFCADYLSNRFGDQWCLSPEHSLCLLVGNRTVPVQLIVRSPMGMNNATSLPHRTSILDVKLPIPAAREMQKDNGLNIYPMALALMFSSPTFFRQNSNDVRAALSSISGASELLSPLLEGGHSLIAGRLAGAFRNIGREKIAEEILATMKSAGYDSREGDPFEQATPLSFTRKVRSPYVSRLRLMWETMRHDVVGSFPVAPRKNVTRYLKQVQDVYATDAYHSLSIEGYKVSLELIEKVRQDAWNPDSSEQDRDHKNALAARGYWQSYQMVQESVTRVLSGENAGVVADADHGTWYRELFAPSVTAGLLRPSDLAGYRSDQVFIRHSKHVPPSRDAVRELMPALFDLIENEDDAAVRAVLGHFVFVYIHPYMDGNGRIGRFLMNVMFASGGYPWTVVPVARRGDYLAALESASVRQDISPLTKLLSTLVKETIDGRPEASKDGI